MATNTYDGWAAVSAARSDGGGDGYGAAKYAAMMRAQAMGWDQRAGRGGIWLRSGTSG